MAQQLLQDRTPTAYAGVEGFRPPSNRKEDAGALAWLVIGYARTLDHDYAKAIDPLNHAKAGASELGDYVAYYLGDAYMKPDTMREALATLADFGKKFPDSLLIRDAHVVYANALFDRRQSRRGRRSPRKRSDPGPQRSSNLAIGRAYETRRRQEKSGRRLSQCLLQSSQQL